MEMSATRPKRTAHGERNMSCMKPDETGPRDAVLTKRGFYSNKKVLAKRDQKCPSKRRAESTRQTAGQNPELGPGWVGGRQAGGSYCWDRWAGPVTGQVAGMQRQASWWLGVLGENSRCSGSER